MLPSDVPPPNAGKEYSLGVGGYVGHEYLNRLLAVLIQFVFQLLDPVAIQLFPCSCLLEKAVLAEDQVEPVSLPVRPGDWTITADGALGENTIHFLLNFEIKEVQHMSLTHPCIVLQ